MAQTLTYLLIFCFPSYFFAQAFTSQNPNWVYKQFNFCVEADIFLSFSADTSILGKNCKVMQKRSERYNRCTQQNSSLLETSAYVYEEQGVVFLFQADSPNIGFDTLYNFTLDSGDCYSFSVPNSSPGLKTKATILQTGTNPTYPSFPNWQLIQYEFGSDFSYTDTVYENIGNVGQYFFPWDFYFEQVDGQEGGQFTCFQNDLASFGPPGLDCGALITHTEETWVQGVNKIAFYPNQSILSTTAKEEEFLHWTLIDLHGRKIKSVFHQKTLDISELSSGLYVVSLAWGNGPQDNIQSLKFYKP